MYSREHLFLESQVRNKALGITFKSGSQAQKNYGEHVTLSTLYTDEEMEEMILNIRANKDTNGVVKAEILTGNQTKVQKDRLKQTGFNTEDIASIIATR